MNKVAQSRVVTLIFCFVVGATYTAATTGYAGHEVGDHGDPFMMMFSSARFDAAQMMIDIDFDHVSTQNQNDFGAEINWLKDKHQAISLDILSSEHVWTLNEADQSSCARTNIPENPQAIHLSLPMCKTSLLATGLGNAEAIRMLIHESSHHFGLKEASPGEEELARRVSVAAYKIWFDQRERREPFWAEIESPLSFGLTFDPRVGHASALSSDLIDKTWKSSLVIFGGCTEQQLPGRPACKKLLGDGARYEFDTKNPRNGHWQALSPNGSPSPRRSHRLTATDGYSNLILTGGCLNVGTACVHLSADTYLLQDDRWSSLPSMPAGRARHTASWGDDRLFVFGGVDASQNGISDLAILTRTIKDEQIEYNWLKQPLGVNIEGRFDHHAVWTGNSLIVWGGCASLRLGVCGKALMDGFIYKPDATDASKDQWSYLPAPQNLSPRDSASLVWTGRYLIVWGGKDGSRIYSDGAILDTSNQSIAWEPLKNLLPPGETGRFQHSAVWDGTRQRMLVIGGRVSTDLTPESFASTILSFSRKDSESNWRWSAINMPNAPTSRVEDSLHSVYDLAVSWGGFTSDGFFSGQGYAFFP